jgi:hypothetical protein
MASPIEIVAGRFPAGNYRFQKVMRTLLDRGQQIDVTGDSNDQNYLPRVSSLIRMNEDVSQAVRLDRENDFLERNSTSRLQAFIFLRVPSKGFQAISVA